MRVINRLDDCGGLAYPVVTIGNFDGVHLGHQAVLQTVKQRALQCRGTVVVLTFDPHPLRVLAPEVDLRFLSDPEEKLELLAAAGVDVVVRLPFTPEFAAQSPEDFIGSVLRKGLGAAELYVGENFRFGRQRQGTIATLKEAGRRLGFTVHAITPVLLEGQAVSSTRIRDLVQEGCVAEAAALLGRLYMLKGTVIRGEGRGSQLGYRTANLLPPAGRVLPPDGVYAARVRLDSRIRPAVIYIGVRPTFNAGTRLIEAHLLDGVADLYGRQIAVEFHERLRGDRVFESPELLAVQIADDVGRTREILRNLSERPAQMPSAHSR
jgi:riboflavin kinase / FMN adenylyltransferase